MADTAIKPSPVQIFKKKLEERLKIEGHTLPIGKSRVAFVYEMTYFRGYLDAMPEGDEKKFFSEFIALLYMSGRSVTTLGI